MAAMLVAVPLTVLAGAAPAQAAAKCVGGTELIAWGQVGSPYPVTLRLTTTYLYTGKTSAAAYARAWLPNGSYISIDRSIARFEPKDATERNNGHGWRTNAEVANSGGYDYCEKYHAGASAYVETPRIDGSHHAVRPCLRINGILQCADKWYLDFD
ncbi:hypothetical protein [Acrocarpospora catenulata]|uniref:hypothetical protein n=1 Tax=Acrocarpospora catenulata TaxID=2836182 RepID=UPI001BDAAC66|nr:hypothetical protein [Acrocarpospora catenulata]